MNGPQRGPVMSDVAVFVTGLVFVLSMGLIVPAQAWVGLRSQRVEWAKLQDVPGVDRIGIPDQRLDLGHRQLLWPRRDRGTG